MFLKTAILAVTVSWLLENSWVGARIGLSTELRVYYKIKIHSSCEIECFVEARLCKLCV